jgi:hypothetical protein
MSKAREGYTNVGVTMSLRHITYLDRIAVDMRLRHGVSLSRSQIIRAFLDLAEQKDKTKRKAGKR